MEKTIALSIDTEFLNFPQLMGFQKYQNTGYGNTGCLEAVRLFKKAGILATFFVCGEFAEKFPKTVRQIVENQHELASHSFSHQWLSNRSEQEQEQEITKSKKFLEKKFGVEIQGFRAPGNQTGKNHFELLKKAGYTYDSSFHPAFLPHQWQNGFKAKKIFQKNGIVEIPLSVLAGMPISWIWMRHSNAWLTRMGVRYNQLANRPTILYLHSWEFELLPAIPRLPKSVTAKTGPKFAQMVSEFITHYQKKGFQFKTVGEIAYEHLHHHSRVQ